MGSCVSYKCLALQLLSFMGFYGIVVFYIYIYIIMNMYALPFQTAQPFYGLVEWEFMGFFDD